MPHSAGTQHWNVLEERRGSCSGAHCHHLLLRKRQKKGICEAAAPSLTPLHQDEPYWLKTIALQNVFYYNYWQSDVHPSILSQGGAWIIQSLENPEINKPPSDFQKCLRAQKQGFTRISSHKACQNIPIHSEPYFHWITLNIRLPKWDAGRAEEQYKNTHTCNQSRSLKSGGITIKYRVF